MILKGSQRGGARQLADHLMNLRDNDHVEVHSTKGFISDHVHGALQEAFAISRGTRAKQFLFSLSLSPPKDALVTITDFENAIEQAAEKLGLSEQPRVVLFHEKNARRHCHVVFSRINAQTMKAINLPFYKTRLTGLSRELYLSHGWDMPKGLSDRSLADPQNFTLEEWQIAQRTKRDPREVKAVLKSCWAQSDRSSAFSAALKEKGFWLARGDRRGFVALDHKGNIYSLSRWLDVKPKSLVKRLDTPDDLPSVSDAQADIAKSVEASVKRLMEELDRRHTEVMHPLLEQRTRIVARQRRERDELGRLQREQQEAEAIRNAKRFRRGVRGLFDWVSGKRAKIKREIAHETLRARECANAEREFLRRQQIIERGNLQYKIDQQRIRNASQKATTFSIITTHRQTALAHSVPLSPYFVRDFEREPHR